VTCALCEHRNDKVIISSRSSAADATWAATARSTAPRKAAGGRSPPSWDAIAERHPNATPEWWKAHIRTFAYSLLLTCKVCEEPFTPPLGDSMRSPENESYARRASLRCQCTQMRWGTAVGYVAVVEQPAQEQPQLELLLTVEQWVRRSREEKHCDATLPLRCRDCDEETGPIAPVTSSSGGRASDFSASWNSLGPPRDACSQEWTGVIGKNKSPTSRAASL
jgi:hypothetical protein